MGEGLGVGASVVVVLFLIVLAVLWGLLPFAVFGIKDVVRDATREQKRTNELLQQVLAEQKRAHVAPPPGPSGPG